LLPSTVTGTNPGILTSGESSSFNLFFALSKNSTTLSIPLSIIVLFTGISST